MIRFKFLGTVAALALAVPLALPSESFAQARTVGGHAGISGGAGGGGASISGGGMRGGAGFNGGGGGDAQQRSI